MGPNDVVLEDATGGMPPASAQTLPTAPAAPPQAPQAPQARPAPDLSQPLLDDDDQPLDEEPSDDDEPQPQGRRSLVGELVRTREQARIHREQSEQSQQLLRQVLSLPGGAELLQAAVTGRPAPAQPGVVSPQEQQEREALLREATEVAQDLGLYDGEGRPDVRLAAKIVLRDRQRITQAVQQAVQPLQQRTLQLGAEPVIQHVIDVAEQWGISPTLVEQGLRATPATELGKPEVQQAVLMMALGTQQMLLQQNAEVPGFGYDAQNNYVLIPRAMQPRGRGPAQPPQPPVRARQGLQVPGVVPQRGAGRPPLFTEPAGGRPRATPQLDDTFRQRLLSTGMKNDDIDSALGAFVPGAPNRLE